jgi:4-amino-4-deoxy-L-arabinose transferase-like glycosyltransferase
LSSLGAVVLWFCVFGIWAFVSSYRIAKNSLKANNFLVFLFATTLTGLTIFSLSDEVGQTLHVIAAALVIVSGIAGLVIGWTDYKPGVRVGRVIGKLVLNLEAIGRIFRPK